MIYVRILRDWQNRRVPMPMLIPSPPFSEFQLGPVPIRFYALCILAGIAVALWLSTRRWRARGGNPATIETIAFVGVPAGIIGARIYHVVTHYPYYFGPGSNPWEILAIWNGGLAIFGGVTLAAVAAYLVARNRRASFAALADTCAPGILIAQGIGRLGNYFNQELFGQPTTVPWGLAIDPAHRPPGFEQYETFHPTFLYELAWNFSMAAVLLWVDRRFSLAGGRLFLLYVALYSFGRFWIEAVRIDEATQVGGFRLNNYAAAVIFAVAVLSFILGFRILVAACIGAVVGAVVGFATIPAAGVIAGLIMAAAVVVWHAWRTGSVLQWSRVTDVGPVDGTAAKEPTASR